MHHAEEDAEDRDLPQELDLDWPGDDETACPECGESVDEDAERCPRCGHWLTFDSPATDRAARWFWPAMVALLVAVVLVMWNRFLN